MARYLGPTCRRCRTSGEKLYLKGDKCYTDKCAVTRRKSKPGGNKMSRQKISDYAIQLREKQKLKYIYGILEAQFYNYYKEASSKSGVTGEMLLQSLERRLDNVVYRMGLAKSRNQARQLVRHGHVTIGGRRVDIPSYRVKGGEELVFSKEIGIAKENVKNASPPSWLDFDRENLKGKIVSIPNREAVDYEINEQLVVEFYSR